MPRSAYPSACSSVRHAVGVPVGVLRGALLAAMAAVVVLGYGTAFAGGPTSVLIVSPEKGMTAAAYHSDEEYDLLMRALEAQPDADRGAPEDLILGPGGAWQLNVTWLIHDVAVWRVDRIVLDARKGVWINTQDTVDGGVVDIDRPGVWHRSSHPDELLALLGRWGMLDGIASVPVEAAPSEDAAARSDGANAPAHARAAPADDANATGSLNTTTTSASTVTVEGVLKAWWLVLPVLVVGLLGGAFGRPGAARLARLARARMARARLARARPADPHQELIDV
jgi:hypothetical protein